MRLIDADSLKIHVVAAVMNESQEHKDRASALLRAIDSIPTAYDFDEIFEELRNLLWDCYADNGIGIDREAGFKAYERELERIIKQNRE